MSIFLITGHSKRCSDDKRVKYHIHRRKYQQYREHTDNCSPRHQHTQRSDHVDAGDKPHAEGGCKKAEGTYDYRLHAGGQGDQCCLLLAIASIPL